ncbi:MAG: hypothetical protein EAZ97_05715 [Bacteroidetes bacterium]|nr:MAG: hypothetical protein EAZ97_05715 [Bacteroidota bacterium]
MINLRSLTNQQSKLFFFMNHSIKIFILLMAFSLPIFAQDLPKNPDKKAKIDDSPIKDKNDKSFEDLMFMGRFYMAKSFDEDSRKNYSQALKHFKNANKINGDSASMEIYKIYIGGGYGVSQDLEEADKYFGWACAKTQISKTFQDQQDLNFCKVQELQKKAISGDQQAMIALALHYFELDFSQHLANYWLDQAISNPDAVFLKERYALAKQRFLGYDSLNLFAKNQAELTEKHAQNGSEMAKMALVALKYSKNEIVDSKNLLANFLKNTFSEGENINLQDELKLKALILLAKTATTSTEKIMAQIEIFEIISQKTAFKTYAFANDIFTESERINQEIITVLGLSKIAARYKIDLALNMSDYEANYGGDLLRLVSLYQNFIKPANFVWIGHKNLGFYKTQINAKIYDQIKQRNTLNEVLESFASIKKADDRGQLLLGTDLENYHQLLDEKINFALKSRISLNELALDYKKIKELAELKEFLETKIDNYKTLIVGQIDGFVANLNDLESILKMKKSFEIDPIRKEMYPNYEEVFAKKITAFGLSELEIFIATQKIEVEFVVFNNLPSLKMYLDNLDKNPILSDPISKQSFLSFIKKKGINDLYGKNASPENQNKLKSDVVANKWLEPEASEMGIFMAYDIFNFRFSKAVQNFDQGKIWYENTNANAYLQKNNKDSLSAILRKKTIKDIYGKNFCGEKLLQFENDLKEKTWLLPEGKDIYWHARDHCDSITIHEQNFKSFAEGKIFYEQYSNSERPEKSKTKTLKRIRRRIVHDIFENEPTRANLESIKENTDLKNTANDWLKPEGNETYLKIYNHCDWHILNIVAKSDSSDIYRYEATRSFHDMESYDLKINKILNRKDYGSQTLVYSSQIVVKKTENSYVVQINYSFRKPENQAMWYPVSKNYFQGIYPQNETSLIPSTEGGKFGELSLNSKHGFSEEYLIQKENSGEFSIKAAIKTALKYFIFNYKAALSEN